MSVQLKPSDKVKAVDPVWDAIRANAKRVVADEPALTSMVMAHVLNQPTFEAALISRLVRTPRRRRRLRRTHPPDLPGRACCSARKSRGEARADLAATLERDPAAHRAIVPFLYFKGYQAVQTHRFANALWLAGRKDFRALSAEPLEPGVPGRHQPASAASARASCSITPPASSPARRR